MSITSLMLMSAMAITGPGGSTAGSIVIPGAMVIVIKEVEVAAEEAGVLRSVEADYGDEVETGQFLAQIADEQAQSQLKVAQRELEIATEKSGNDVNVRYSRKSYQVAAQIYNMAREANQKVGGTVAHADMLQKLYEAERANLSIEQADRDMKIAAIEADAAGVRVDAAEEAVARRKITAPLSGEVVDVLRQAGEWVTPGDPVYRIIQLDRLRVQGFVDETRYTRADLLGSEVTFTAALPGGDATFTGKVTFVSPEIEGSGYRVWAEVINKRDRGHWQLLPDMPGRMAIKLSTVASRTGDRPRPTPMPGPNLR